MLEQFSELRLGSGHRLGITRIPLYGRLRHYELETAFRVQSASKDGIIENGDALRGSCLDDAGPC
jgi:hypothetical protein